MDIILIPGLWLDGSSWDAVVPVLEAAGHRAHALTLPGMEDRDVDRSSITLADHVAAVVAVIDALDGRPVVLVGHSAGAAIAHAALDARPDRVARAIHIGGFPTGDGAAIVDGFTVAHGEVALPAWSSFEDEELAHLDEAARAEFRRRAIPSPAAVTTDPQRLVDRRRYDVPVTVICPEFTSAALRRWIDQDLAAVRELAMIADVELVDLPTGHWPQFTRPLDLGELIIDRIERDGAMSDIDEQGRQEPPLTGDEVATVLGFLDYQRATLAWKCGGLDADGLVATVGASSMTLGGLLKHLAYVEDDWCSRWLHGREKSPPWDAVDWTADRDWDWHSAADDTPQQLFALWQAAVARSRALVDAALVADGMDAVAKRTWPDGRAPSLRWILVHLIEEYARHNGHADLLRESVDGATGE